MRGLARLGRAPAVHFVLAGGALYALAAGRSPEPAPRAPVVVTAADVERLRVAWIREHGAAPSRAAEAMMLDDAVEEEILVREALLLGLDRTDRLVRERVTRLESFLGEGAGDPDAAARELARSDVVTRRHLAQMMRLAAGRLGTADLPSEAELQAYLTGHRSEFQQPDRVTLTHVYLAEDRRGAGLEADALALLAALRREPTPPAAAPSRGDPFLRGARIEHASAAELERIFGPGFAARIADAPLGAWIGPVRSSYGLHLVWLEERAAPHLPPLAAVERQVLHGLLDERRTERRLQRIAALRARWEIEPSPVAIHSLTDRPRGP